jgi:hypothetical protein
MPAIEITMVRLVLWFCLGHQVRRTAVRSEPFRALLVQLSWCLSAWASFGTRERFAECHRNTAIGSFLCFGSGSRSWERLGNLRVLTFSYFGFGDCVSRVVVQDSRNCAFSRVVLAAPAHDSLGDDLVGASIQCGCSEPEY